MIDPKDITIVKSCETCSEPKPCISTHICLYGHDEPDENGVDDYWHDDKPIVSTNVASINEAARPLAALQITFEPAVNITPRRLAEILNAAVNKIERCGGPRFKFTGLDIVPFERVPERPEPAKQDKPLVIAPSEKIVLTDGE